MSQNKRITIVVSESLLRDVKTHIEKNLGGSSRAISMVVRQALKEYLRKK
jgi:metal-responsive CopG/Arc/MetJ family transcriptional regulator